MRNLYCDSPWKEAVEQYFPEFIAFFIAFYSPAAHAQIDWSFGYDFLDQELRAVVQDAELGKRFVDKLVRVTRLSGREDMDALRRHRQKPRHSRAGGNPECVRRTTTVWIPACAGMTERGGL